MLAGSDSLDEAIIKPKKYQSLPHRGQITVDPSGLLSQEKNDGKTKAQLGPCTNNSAEFEGNRAKADPQSHDVTAVM